MERRVVNQLAAAHEQGYFEPGCRLKVTVVGDDRHDRHLEKLIKIIVERKGQRPVELETMRDAAPVKSGWIW